MSVSMASTTVSSSVTACRGSSVRADTGGELGRCEGVPGGGGVVVVVLVTGRWKESVEGSSVGVK